MAAGSYETSLRFHQTQQREIVEIITLNIFTI